MKFQIKNLARRAFEKAIAINPNYADAYFWYSHAVIEMEKDFELALEILENAIRLNPLSTKFINRLANDSNTLNHFIHSYLISVPAITNDSSLSCANRNIEIKFFI